ncbi:DUF2062 domain-containing protein [Bacillus sp. ISL-45]|uniref:DUF2062 domain-containing protein n=1 Tax=Bacillus sp. ISL-39 TaxID=2819124 RepID=UPI001BEB29A6|nr:DUF2062 domain-containing protein [Bacillus sp. ISL-39]MBT2638350.1 DUF2062 domain-containing protein [Bacillus sp. ISL-39]MBT2661294.1 DUF2062 domain-containing protein [Bacillus sp. ISL-45]
MIKKNLRRFKFLLIKLFRIKENAHNVSLGFTLGFLIHFIPSFGMGPILSTVGAKLFKGNPLAGFISGVALIWLFPFLFYLNVVVGETLFPYGIFPSASGMPSHGLDAGIHLGAVFFIGMIINIILFGMFVYYIIYTIMRKYRSNFLALVKKWDIKK